MDFRASAKLPKLCAEPDHQKGETQKFKPLLVPKQFTLQSEQGQLCP